MSRPDLRVVPDPPAGSSAGGSRAPRRVLSTTVAVLTYRRPDFLTDLIADLVREIERIPVESGRIRLLVVDNDPLASAQQTVLAQRPAVELRYVVEPRRGIAAARNRVLLECGTEDLLVFIDDDERPDPGWLEALLSTYAATGAAGVSGPVRTRYLTEPDPWALAGRFVDRSHRDGLATGDAVVEAATNNLLLDLAAVRDLRLSFDESVQLSSGEDAIFTRQLTGSGRRIVWCADAWVTDLRPGDRTTRRALLRRAYSFSNAGVLVRVRLGTSRSDRARVRAAALAGGLARLAAGSASFVLGCAAAQLRWRANGARLVARGAGAVTAALGLRYQEYQRAGAASG